MLVNQAHERTDETGAACSPDRRSMLTLAGYALCLVGGAGIATGCALLGATPFAAAIILVGVAVGALGLALCALVGVQTARLERSHQPPSAPTQSEAADQPEHEYALLLESMLRWRPSEGEGMHDLLG